MKLAPLYHECNKHDSIEHIIVDSGQHYDDDLSSNFLKEFDVSPPDYSLQIGSGSANEQIGLFLMKIDAILQEVKPDILVVYGDTNTTAAGAIAAAKCNIPLAHIEAGLREWDKSIPEETNKLITDAVADLYFCPTSKSVENLWKEGVVENVFLTGDITLDLLKHQKEYKGEQELKEKYGVENELHLFTCHRAANTDNHIHLKEIVDFLNHTDFEFMWPLHPRMKNALLTNGWSITNPKIKIIPPIGYWETQSIIRHSRAVVTDSGGVIKEAYFHKTPAIIIDKQTEWMEAVEEGWHRIAGPSKDMIDQFVADVPKPTIHTNAFGIGNAAPQIVKAIKDFIQNR